MDAEDLKTPSEWLADIDKELERLEAQQAYLLKLKAYYENPSPLMPDL